MTATPVRVVLPAHLRALAHVSGELSVRVGQTCTLRAVLDAVEAQHPVLRGTLRDPATGRRRAFVRFFACRQDLSHDDVDAALPVEVSRGEEPLLVVGAMAGG